MLTAHGIDDLVQAWYHNGDSRYYRDNAWNQLLERLEDWGLPTEPLDIAGLTFKLVEQHGGEGEGDDYWIVVEITENGSPRLFRKDGWYASYDGGYLDGDLYEVEPAQVTKTIYVKV